MWPNFINMLSWWQWTILAIVPPAILLLYFLKLKRQPLVVPSTYLWRRSIEDLHVNSIWQRLRRNLLLLLQLLLVALAMLALLRPSWQASALSGDRFVFLIDNSASMSATDVQPTRLDEAKRQVLALIDQMESGDRAMLISFADDAQVMQEFTDNRQALRRRVEAIEPTQSSTSLLTALKLAAGLANPGRTASDSRDLQVAEAMPADVFIYSDGRFPDVQGFSLGNLRPIFAPIGRPKASNVGITAFAADRVPGRPDEVQAFCQVANFGLEPVEVELQLYRDDQLVDARAAKLAPGKSSSEPFDSFQATSCVLRVTVSPGDPLALDNTAYAVVNVPRRSKVLLITPGNEPLTAALATDRARELAEVKVATPDILKTEAYKNDSGAGALDLIIYDQCRPEAMPLCNTLFIGRLPPLASWRGDRPPQKVVGPQIIDTDRAHPLLQLVELTNVDIYESIALEPPPGSTVLIDSSQGKLFCIGPREAMEDAVLGFELLGQDETGAQYVNTNWPLRVSFPTFIFNVLEYLGGHSRQQNALSYEPGQIIELRSESTTPEVNVRSPDGKLQSIGRGKRNSFTFSNADQTGVYEVVEGKQVTQRFAVNLFDSNESTIAPRDEEAIQIGYVEVKGKAGWEPTRRETWKLLLGLALVVLIFEWYIYNRRVYL